MTPNRRIFLNIVATYGRSLYALIVGLFCGRWALMALGQVDYGLMGVVGGMTVFISFFNARFAGAVARFYALSVGKQQADSESGVEECRMWFTTAVVIHTILPTLLMIVGYPLGEWAVRNYLTIPIDRVNDCIWVWRFVCISCFLGMVTIPMNAMYTAHQYIAELTIYGFVTTTLNAVVLYYMITHPGIWLSRFAFWKLLMVTLPNLIIAIRAFYLFKECRFLPKYVCCLENVRKLFSYVVWTCIGTFGGMLRDQGVAILVNKMFGPVMNASMAVGLQLTGQTNTLSGSLAGAFSPAVVNAWGAGDYGRARMMAYRVCKLGVLFMLIFALPLCLESEEVLRLWLKKPPEYAAELCVFFIVSAVIDKSACGHMYLVNARGRIAQYQIVLGTSLILTLPLAYAFVKFGFGIYGVGCALVLGMMGCAWGRVWFARKLVGLSARYWLKRVFLPLVALGGLTLFAGSLTRLFLDQSLLRVAVTTIVTEAIILPLAYFVVLDSDERKFLSSRIPFARKRGAGDADS